MGDIIMSARKLTKVFGDLVANDAIDLDIEAGKIHAIAGENGAGKSTLMKMLYGVYPVTSGDILVDGHVVPGWSSALAREKGISMVFQDFRLISAFTVLENVFLSLTKSGIFVNRKALRKQIIALCKEYNLHVNPDQEVWSLDLGQRQHIEIIKVLINTDTRVMIFDEPTSVLAAHEVASFLEMLTKFRDKGYAIVLITHKINEIIAVADCITVLRQGKKVASLQQKETYDHDTIIAHILGEEMGRMERVACDVRQDELINLPVVRLENIAVKDEHNRRILKNVNFDIKPGEILGVAGISGNGQRELAEALMGIRKIVDGALWYGSENITAASPKKRIACGFRMVTEDPMRDNMVPAFTVLKNMALVGLDVVIKAGDIDWRAMQEQFDAHTEIDDLHVPAAHRVAGTLSGGNVQRVAFARAVISRPKLLVACYPSRGLDVATVNAVHNTLIRLKSEGVAVLLICEDMVELFEMSDRIVVLASRTAFGPFSIEDCDMNGIGKLMLKGEAEDEKSYPA